MSGSTEELIEEAREYRDEVAAALLTSLINPRRRAFGEAFRALAALGAVEMLPTLLERVPEVKIKDLREMCQKAIEDLESLQSLPRPAMSPLDTGDTLPRVAGRGRVTPMTLPRSAPTQREEPLK